MARANKTKHKVWHELNFYLGLVCFVCLFFAEEQILATIMFIAFIVNILSAQILCNKHNIEELYKEKYDE